MSIKIIQDKLNQYSPKSRLEEENALKEIAQEIILSALSRSGFFKVAAFQGGTCLRIIHGMNRFSEDLDFALNKPNPSFKWAPYLKNLQTELEVYGFKFEIEDRDKDKPVKNILLKDATIVNLLNLNYENQGTPKLIKIKLEIDTIPPLSAKSEQKYIHFPVTVPVVCHDLPSLFAGKSHALLCRKMGKGRDWFDFTWYVARGTSINFELLSNSIEQFGPWKGQKIQVNRKWYFENLAKKIKTISWDQQRKDLERFLKPKELDILEHWSVQFFLNLLTDLIPSYQVRVSVRTKDGKMKSYVKGDRFYYEKEQAFAIGEEAFKNTPAVILVEVFQSLITKPIALFQ